MYRIKGGSRRPSPPIVSCVTGKADYDAENSRDLMIRWTDQPQRLWDAIETLLNSGVRDGHSRRPGTKSDPGDVHPAEQ